MKAGADKAELRRRFRQLRRASLADSQRLILAVARRDLPALLPAGQRLGIYWPLAGEVDLRPLAADQVPLALPAVRAESPAGPAPGQLHPELPQPARLLYLPWQPGEPLAPDHCGIPAPLASSRRADPRPAPGQPKAVPPGLELPPAALALLLVPALALDPHSGIRLGSGGGWYDRLRADPTWRAVPAVAVLPAACVLADLPRDPWDVPFAGWLDETGLHWLASRHNIAAL